MMLDYLIRFLDACHQTMDTTTDITETLLLCVINTKQVQIKPNMKCQPILQEQCVSCCNADLSIRFNRFLMSQILNNISFSIIYASSAHFSVILFTTWFWQLTPNLFILLKLPIDVNLCFISHLRTAQGRRALSPWKISPTSDSYGQL